MLKKSIQKITELGNKTKDNVIKKSNIVVNMINIADVIDSHNMEVASSCIAIIGIEPFAVEKFTVEGLKRDIRITKDHSGNLYINNMKAEFMEIDDGIKVLFILSEEKDAK